MDSNLVSKTLASVLLCLVLPSTLLGACVVFYFGEQKAKNGWYTDTEWGWTGGKYKQQSDMNREVEFATLVMSYITWKITIVIMQPIVMRVMTSIMILTEYRFLDLFLNKSAKRTSKQNVMPWKYTRMFLSINVKQRVRECDYVDDNTTIEWWGCWKHGLEISTQAGCYQ